MSESAHITPGIAIAIAACTFDVGGAPSTAIQLLPAGVIRGKDGRTHGGLPGWRVDASTAARVTKELPIGDSL